MHTLMQPVIDTTGITRLKLKDNSTQDLQQKSWSPFKIKSWKSEEKKKKKKVQISILRPLHL